MMLIFIWNLPRCVSHNAFSDALYMKNACYFGQNLRQHHITAMRETDKSSTKYAKKVKTITKYAKDFFQTKYKYMLMQSNKQVFSKKYEGMCKQMIEY